MRPQALDAAPDDAEAHGTYLAALNRHKKPAEVLRVADAHRPASNPAVVVEVCLPKLFDGKYLTARYAAFLTREHAANDVNKYWSRQLHMGVQHRINW